MREWSADENVGVGSGLGSPRVVVGVTSAQTCLVLPSRLKALREGGFRVSLVSSPGTMAARGSEVEGVSAHEIPMARAMSLLKDAVAFTRILCLLRHLKPEIVEFSTPKAGLLGMLAAWICRVPVRIYFVRGLRLETVPAFMKAILLWSERIAAACAHTVVVNSRSLRERTLLLGITGGEKVVLLGEGSSNGVDIERFSPGPSEVRADFGIPVGARVVGFVGRLTTDKGLPELLEGFAEVLREMPDSYLLLVGWFDASEDALGTRLRLRIEGHPRIVCTGYVADTAPYYRAMDVLVLPSWREGFPNAVLEAASSGVPVVTTTCTGSRDAVVPEVTGLLIPPGDPGMIAKAALRLLRDGELRGSMSQAARHWAVTHFEQSRVLGEMVRFYRHLLTSSANEMAAENAARPATAWTASL